MENAISVEDLSKQYRLGNLQSENMLRIALVNLVKHPFRKRDTNGDVLWALREVSFEVNHGEVLGIIGRNGAGKSTLLKVLSKITYPTSGKVKVNGRVGSLLEVGTGFHEELTGKENIYLNGSILGMKKKEVDSKLKAIVDFADVERFIDTPIKRYSSGMRLRLGFAVAANLDTDVLFVDEVLAVGDVGFQKKCLKTMGDLQNKGRTVLFVSHNMAVVENLCSRVIWIDNGMIRQDGNPKEVIATYMSTFAEAYMSGLDLRDVQVRRGNGKIRFTRIEFLSYDREPLKIIRSGDRLVVRLYYCAENDIANNIIMGFRVFTELGTLVTDVSNGVTGTEISFLPKGEGYIEFEIGFLNLMPDRYYLSLWLHNDASIIYDALEHSVTLDVEVSDFYKSGKGITNRNGIMFLPFTCKFDR